MPADETPKQPHEVEPGTEDAPSPPQPNELALLRTIVEAHAKSDPHSHTREPIYFLEHHGAMMHHAISGDPPYIDGALVDDLQRKGLISVEYGGQGTQKITPTSFGRETIQGLDRSEQGATADASPIIEALTRQSTAPNPMAWPAIRPVLEAFRDYWQASGYPAEGVGVRPLLKDLPDDLLAIFAATVRALSTSGYVDASPLTAKAMLDDGSTHVIPVEISLTGKSREVLDGWPGATPRELVDNLLAVLTFVAANEPDPQRRGRLEGLVTAIKDVGVAVTSEVLAKVITGGVT